MATLTVSSTRFRTEAKTFYNSTLGGIESDYAAYELSKAEDATKTWTVRVISSFYDGSNFVLVAEASYPERNSDPLGQIPVPSAIE